MCVCVCVCVCVSLTFVRRGELQAIEGLYCVGDSCFPGQGVIAVAFSGIMCAHRVAADIGNLQLSSELKK